MATPWTGPQACAARRALRRSLAQHRRHRGTSRSLRAAAPVIAAASCAGRAVPADASPFSTMSTPWSGHRSRPAARPRSTALLKGLAGRFVAPGPSGAPTRGRLDVLPTGRNFYSLDNRTVPTPTAWNLGQKSAEDLLTRHFQDFGQYPKAIGLSAWGTSNMRTGGDDIAQALALIGAKPVWEPSSWRVTGFEIIPLARAWPSARRRDACASRASSAMPSRRRSNFSTRPSARSARSTRTKTTIRLPPACEPRLQAFCIRRHRRRPTPGSWPATASSARSPAPMARACRR